MPTNMHNIARVDHKSTHGYIVRIVRRGIVDYYGFFPDLRCGGKRKALRDAREKRDAIFKKYKITAKIRCRIAHNHLSCRNTSGHIGISRVSIPLRRGGETVYYVAQWYPEKYKPARKWIPVREYGEQGALKRAIELREQGIQKAKLKRKDHTVIIRKSSL